MVKKTKHSKDEQVDDTGYLSQTISDHDATDDSVLGETTLDIESELTLKSNALDEDEDSEVDESGSLYDPGKAVDQDADGPEAGTPGHPGIDEDTA